MKFSTSNLLTKKNLLNKVDSYSIFKAYCANFDKLGQSFKSTLPDRPQKDTNASCQIAYIRGDLLYTDFGEASYRAIDYVIRKYHVSYKDALRKINSDFQLGLYDPDNNTTYSRTPLHIKQPKKTFKEKTPTIIDVRYAIWTPKEIEYWAQFGWTYQMLQRASIKPIDFFWITMEHRGLDKLPFSVKDELAFSYDFYRHEDVFRRKLYFPERIDENRFSSNVDNTVIQNWDILPKQGGDILFITSSKKDCGPHWRLNGFNCNAIAPNNEKTFIPEEIYWKKIHPRWKRKIVWLDNDSTGIENALEWAKKYQMEAMWNPINAPKDQSDFVKEHGLREFNHLQNKLVWGR